MATGSITKRSVDALKAGPKDHFLWSSDRPGFGVKVTPAGRKIYIIQYRMGGRGSPTKRFTIGLHGVWTPDQADREAGRLLRLVDTGTDPAEEKAKAAEQRRTDSALAFPEYATLFLERYVKHEWKRSYDFAESILRLHVTPRWKSKALPAIRKSDVAALFDAMPADKAALRRNVFAVIRRLFNWGVGRGDLEKSPLEGFEPPSAAESRERVLKDWELRLAWLCAADLGYPFRPFYRLLGGTGQRRDEVAELDWRELDRARAEWLLPAERAKNGVATIVHLSALMIAELDAIAGGEKWPTRGYVLTTNGGRSPISGFSRAKTRLDASMLALARKEAAKAGEDPDVCEIGAWRVHDLRRTLATGMQRLGVRFEVVEAVLNHVSGSKSKSSVAAVYQRHDWADEKRDALNAWAAHIERFVSGADTTNVIPLAERRA